MRHGEDEDREASPPKDRTGRFGPLFGTTVHKAIELAMRDPALGAAKAAERAIRMCGLKEHEGEVAADVRRALEALEREGLLRPVGPELRLEYPVAGVGEGGVMLIGSIDLIAADGKSITIIDFKTDAPPSGSLDQSMPDYLRQLEAYGELVRAAKLPGHEQIRLGLLFTGDGSLHWHRTKSQ